MFQCDPWILLGGITHHKPTPDNMCQPTADRNRCIYRVSSRIPESNSIIFPWFFQKYFHFPGYKHRINMNEKRLLLSITLIHVHVLADHRTKKNWQKSMYNNKLYNGMYYEYLKCEKLDSQSLKSMTKFPDFSR